MKVLRITGNSGKKLESGLKNLKGLAAKVGWVKQKYYEDSEMTTAGAAALTEFGVPTKNNPPRPHGRQTIIKNKNKWIKVVNNESKKVIHGEQTGEVAMERIGLVAAGDWRKTITELFDPPLSPRTIAARLRKRKDKKTVGSLTKPLIDTGIMLGSLTNTVEKS
jgi:hypothetical protein